MIKILNFQRRNPGEVLSWSMYDFANSAFATSILAVIFNQYFAEKVAYGAEGTWWRILGADIRIPGVSLFHYAVVISMIMVVSTAPILGAIADFSRAKKRFLAFFCLLGCVATSLLYYIRAGDYISGGILFIIANFAFTGGNVFYNGLLLDIAHPDDMGKISGWGWGLGYLGGGLCLALNLLMLQNPGLLGLSEVEVYHTFPVVAGWWLIFALPLFLWVREAKKMKCRREMNILKIGFARIRATFKEIKRYRQLVRFLIAYFLFNDGIETTIITASIFGAQIIGLQVAELIVFFLVVQGTAFIGSLLFGYLVDWWGNKKALLLSLAIWSIIILWARFIGFMGAPLKEFYILGIMTGLVLGGSQSAARSLLASFTPLDKGAEFFGFFAICGKLAAIFGPLILGTAVVITGNLKSGILVLLPLFIIGGIILCFVDEKEGIQAVRRHNESQGI